MNKIEELVAKLNQLNKCGLCSTWIMIGGAIKKEDLTLIEEILSHESGDILTALSKLSLEEKNRKEVSVLGLLNLLESFSGRHTPKSKPKPKPKRKLILETLNRVFKVSKETSDNILDKVIWTTELVENFVERGLRKLTP